MHRVPFDEICRLFGFRIDAPEVVDFLCRFPGHRVGKPEDGAKYVTFRSLGFDLMFRPLTGYQGGRTKHLRVLVAVFLFRQGEERHDQFDDLPFGVSFSDTRGELVGKIGEPFASNQSIGLGTLVWEKWKVGELLLHAMYDRETMTTRTFTVSPAADAA